MPPNLSHNLATTHPAIRVGGGVSLYRCKVSGPRPLWCDFGDAAVHGGEESLVRSRNAPGGGGVSVATSQNRRSGFATLTRYSGRQSPRSWGIVRSEAIIQQGQLTRSGEGTRREGVCVYEVARGRVRVRRALLSWVEDRGRLGLCGTNRSGCHRYAGERQRQETCGPHRAGSSPRRVAPSGVAGWWRRAAGRKRRSRKGNGRRPNARDSLSKRGRPTKAKSCQRARQE